MPASTRSTIVTEAGQLLGNPDIGTRLNTWLNLLLRYLHQAYSWDHLKRSRTFTLTASTATLAWASDFRGASRADLITMQLRLSSEDNWRDPLRVISLEEYFEKVDRRSAALTAEPEAVAIDFQGSQYRFYPTPDAAYAGEELYYYLPADISSDSTSPTLPLDAFLVWALVDIGTHYEQDNRFVVSHGYMRELLGEFRRMHFQTQRRSGGAVPLDPAVFASRPGALSTIWPDRR